MALTGLRPSQLDVTTIKALQDKLVINDMNATSDVASTILYGKALTNIRRKLRTMIGFGKPADSIRIAVFADSIFASSSIKAGIVAYFHDTYAIPEANIDVNCNWGAYTNEQYLPCLDGVAIQPNVDLVILNEMGGTDIMWQMLAAIRAHTNADIMVGSWSVHADLDPIPRYWDLVDMAHYFRAELFDLNGILLRKDLTGEMDTLLQSPTSVHLSTAGGAFFLAEFIKHFEQDRFYNDNNDDIDITEDIYFLGAEICLPLHSNITFSGTWAKSGANLYDAIRATSSTATDFIEITFTGIGFEAVFAASAAEDVQTILIDSAAPSAYVKANGHYLEYCTQLIGKTQTNATWYFHRFFAAYVTAPFMTNTEDEVEFEITIDTVTRVGGVPTAIEYTLRQGVDVLGTGDIFADATFVFRTTGEITIPATVYGTPNFWEVAGYPFTAGDTIQFFARKTWKDSIDTNTETYLRVSGLDRGAHTLRITKTNNVATAIRYISIYK